MTGPSCGAGCDDAAMPTGAEGIVAELEAAGVELVFGLPGVHNLALWEALRRSPIRLVGVRHEQAAAYAADGYARATGRLGVALTTTGPGAANTLGAVGEAWASRSPVLVIATDIPSDVRRPGVYRGALHETTGQADMFAPVVAASHVVRVAAGVTGAAREAAADAVRLRRPAYLEVPTDLLAGERAGDAPRAAAARGAGAGATSRRGRRPRARRRRRAPARVGGRRRARPAGRGRRAGRAAGRAGPHDLHRPRRAPAGAPVRGRHAAARPGRRPAVGRGGRGHRLRLRPRRRQHAELAAAPAAATRRRQPGPGRRREELPRRRGRAGARPGAPAAPGTAARRSTRRGSARCARRRAARSTRPPCGSSTPCPTRCPRTPWWSATCASPATGSRPSTASTGRACSSSRWAGARSASPSPPRSARRSPASARRSRSRATAASCSPAASSRRWRRRPSRSPW